MRNVHAVNVDEGREQLLHDHGCLSLGQVLLVDDVLEKLATLAVLEHQETDVVPLPDFLQLDDVWVILYVEKGERA
jgi:hypothetical protein